MTGVFNHKHDAFSIAKMTALLWLRDELVDIVDVTSRLHFYEKVIKVKADVAALHIVFLRHRRRYVRWRGELSRAPSLGVHLDP